MGVMIQKSVALDALNPIYELIGRWTDQIERDNLDTGIDGRMVKELIAAVQRCLEILNSD